MSSSTVFGPMEAPKSCWIEENMVQSMFEMTFWRTGELRSAGVPCGDPPPAAELEKAISLDLPMVFGSGTGF